MKKFYISALGMLLGLSGLAQSTVSISTVDIRSQLQPAPAKLVTQSAAFSQRIKALGQKTQGGPIDQIISHTEVALDAFSTDLDGFIEPFYMDSTVRIDFGTPRHISTHGIGQTFDPASTAFQTLGLSNFSQADSYTVDSAFIVGIYDIVDQGLSGATGDILRFEIVWALPGVQAATAPFVNLQFNANAHTNQPAVFPMLSVRYAGSPLNGDVGGLTWGGKITINKALTTADSAITLHGVAVGQLIPAGAKVGVSVKYIPNPAGSLGEVYFAGNGGSLPATMNSYRAALYASGAANDDFGYFLERIEFDPESWGIPQLLILQGRYGTFTNSILNQTYLPYGTVGCNLALRVSGLSTFGLNDSKTVDFSVFPNPSYGNFKVRVAEAGNYTISLLNTLGQEVLRMNTSAMANETIPVNATLAKGIYLMNVTLNGVTTTEKISIR